MRAGKQLTCLVVLVAGASLSTGAWADSEPFAAGSLIIPMQSNFQTPCGVFSSYGLIYRILMENQPGGYFTTGGNHAVTVYEIIEPSKQSPNRCIPTNMNTAPGPNSGAATWTDGCDFSIPPPNKDGSPIVNTGIPPVVPVPDGAPMPPATPYFTPVTQIRMYSPSAQMAQPAYPKPAAYSTPGALSQINYLGSPFVISSTDAPEVLTWMNTKLSDPTLAWFSTYNSALETACNDYNTLESVNLDNTGYQVTWNYHDVAIHQATVDFVAPVGRRLTDQPPKIALIKTLSPTLFPDGGGGKMSGGVVESYLDAYLHEAGLFFKGVPGITDSGGCPKDSNDTTCTLNGSSGGNNNPGLIYDQFSANLDLISMIHNGTRYPNGLINATDSTGKAVYPVLWAPHWEGANSTYSTVSFGGSTAYIANDAGSAQDANAMNNLAYYATQKDRGILLECASIASVQTSTTNPPRLLDLGNISAGGSAGVSDGQNCSDPNVSSGSCLSYPSPNATIAQIGDFHFHPMAGAVADFTGARQSWNSRLVDSKDGNTDYIDFGYYEGDTQKAAIVYISGHDYSGDSAAEPVAGDGSGGSGGVNKKLQVPGVRVVLNTLLNLGFAPVTSERAVAAPTGYVDPNQTNLPMVLDPTFFAVLSAPAGAENYKDTNADGSGGKAWIFPYNNGDVRAHPLSGGGALVSGDNAFTDDVLWSADAAMPPPQKRNLFTYLGGQFTTDSTTTIPGTSSTVAGGRPLTNGVLQGGWLSEAIDGTILGACSGSAPSTCLNIDTYGSVVGIDGGVTPGLAPGQDGFCDVQQALNFSPLTSGTWGGACSTANGIAMDHDLTSVVELLQRIRGFCYAHDGAGHLIPAPTDATQCDPADIQFDNRAHFGGVLHSQAAIIPQSANVPDKGASRPTVAYVGGLDGQLHALYVSGGSGYQGPANAIHLPNAPANYTTSGRPAVFRQDYLPVNWDANAHTATATGTFTPPPAGTELWSFMPASQLQQAFNNAGRVDSSPVVQDIFADFTGTGVREWHTVLVVSMGPKYSEVAAVDITNPLEPALLWDNAGSWTPVQAGVNVAYPAIPLAASGTGGAALPYKWDEDVANFVLGDITPASGRTKATPYDFSDLGASSGVSIGQLRAGLEPEYLAFVTSSSGTNVAREQVFAIDIPTGQKVWQWQETYGLGTMSAVLSSLGSVPPVGSLYESTDGVQRVLTGDQQGRLWELNALTGQNWNIDVTATGLSPNGLPAFDVGSMASAQEPITTNVAIAMVPSSTNAGSDFQGYENATVLLMGTAGADWVTNTSPGEFHALLFDDKYRTPFAAPGGGNHLGVPPTAPGAPWPAPGPLNWAKNHSSGTGEGVLQEAPGMPIVFPATGTPPAAQRLYGNITVTGQDAIFQTSVGSVPDDFNTLPATIQGNAYTLNLGTATGSTASSELGVLSGTSARFGATAVVHGPGGVDYIVGNQVGNINVQVVTNPSTFGSANNANLSIANGQSKSALNRLVGWMVRFFQ